MKVSSAAEHTICNGSDERQAGIAAQGGDTTGRGANR